MTNTLELGNVTAMVSFASVVEVGSFSGAAERLGCSKAAVSRQVARLEETLGVKLLNRTTRRVSVTPAGKEFYIRCARIADEVSDATELMLGMLSEPRGELRVNAPVVFTLFRTTELIPRFVRENPSVSVDLQLSDRRVDLLNEGFDVAFWFGEPYDSTLDAVKLATFQMVLCGSPDYLERRGEPEEAGKVGKHHSIVETHLSRPGEWHLAPNLIVAVRNTRLTTNSVRIAREAALNGVGLAFLPSFIVSGDIESGRLRALLTDQVKAEIPLYAIYPKQQYQLAKVRGFIEFLHRVISDGAPSVASL
jgi:DNA-binding transcriptional LysR family regulator